MDLVHPVRLAKAVTLKGGWRDGREFPTRRRKVNAATGSQARRASPSARLAGRAQHRHGAIGGRVEEGRGRAPREGRRGPDVAGGEGGGEAVPAAPHLE